MARTYPHAILCALTLAMLASCGEAPEPSVQNNGEEDPGASAPTPTDGKADIYGEDDRQELYRSSPLVREIARSTAVISNVSNLYIGDDGNIWTRAKTWSESIRGSEGAPLCEGERFREQPVGGHCSSFLIAPDLVATAGHCVNSAHSCDQLRFIFDYAYTSSALEDSVRRIEREDLYQCAAVLGHLYNPDAATRDELRSREYWSDWAVIKLDRPVTGRAPLRLRKSGSPARGDAITTIGYPGGVPAKATSGTIQDTSKSLYFNTDLDIYGGNSGGVTIAGDGLVEGIVIRGTGGKSFHREGSCMVSDTCDSFTGTGTCTGNHVQRIAPVLQFTEVDKVITKHQRERFSFNEQSSGVVEFQVDDPGKLRYVTVDARIYHWNPKELRISIERVGSGERTTLIDRSPLEHSRFTRTTQEFSGQTARGTWRVRFEDVNANGTSTIAGDDVKLHLGIGDAVTPAPRQTFIGSPCSSNADCTFSDEATCRAFAGADGYCVIPCQGYCPDRAGFATTFCVGDDRNDSGQCVPKAHTANGYCESYEGVTPQDVERFIGASSASAATAAVCF